MRISSKLPILAIFLSNFLFSVLLYLNMSSRPVPQIQCACPTVTSAPCKTEHSSAQVSQLSLQAEDSHYLLVILVLSSPNTRNRRDTIRQTWMKGHEQRTQKVLVKFSLGLKGLSLDETEKLESENTIYGDLLLLKNLRDSYFNLTMKVLETFVALNERYQFSYLMKCDDDTFVVLDVVLTELEQRRSERSYYWGFFDGRAHVKRHGKWKESLWFLSDRYLPYALGGGYVLSQDLVKRIVTNSAGLTLYNNEDVSVGVWLSPYSAERRHDVRFNTEFVSRGCRNNYIVSHKQSAEEMISKQDLLDKNGKQCSREFQTRMSYIYNWTEEPSKCCKRTKGVP